MEKSRTNSRSEYRQEKLILKFQITEDADESNVVVGQ